MPRQYTAFHPRAKPSDRRSRGVATGAVRPSPNPARLLGLTASSINQKTPETGAFWFMAEEAGFEPARGFLPHTLSRRAP